jgi:ornithine cyclodeaminase
MHVDLSSGGGGEVHIKSSYRRGASRWALKVAGTYATRPYGSIVLVSAEDGATLAYFDDGGYLTDLRTAAVAAMTARELGRADETLAILGTGVQARLQASLHAGVLPLREVRIWGRDRAKAERCARDVAASLPGVAASAVGSPAEAAASARLIVTATASRAPLLAAADLCPGTHVSAVGSDTPGKQELDPEILRGAALLLVDSKAQCERLGELQHARSEAGRAIELGAFCERPTPFDRAGITVADFTGLGAEDLYIAEACLARISA